MLFQVKVTGRRLSDNQTFELTVKRDAPSSEKAKEVVLQEYDFEDAATRNVEVNPLPN